MNVVGTALNGLAVAVLQFHIKSPSNSTDHHGLVNLKCGADGCGFVTRYTESGALRAQTLSKPISGWAFAFNTYMRKSINSLRHLNSTTHTLQDDNQRFGLISQILSFTNQNSLDGAVFRVESPPHATCALIQFPAGFAQIPKD